MAKSICGFHGYSAQPMYVQDMDTPFDKVSVDSMDTLLNLGHT